MLFWLFHAVAKTEKVVRCCSGCRQFKRHGRTKTQLVVERRKIKTTRTTRTTFKLNLALRGNKDNKDNRDNFELPYNGNKGMLFWLFHAVAKTEKVVRCCSGCRQFKRHGRTKTQLVVERRKIKTTGTTKTTFLLN